MSTLEEMSLARGRYRIVMMSCGYVENAMTSWLIFTTHYKRFETAAQAVIELALDIYAKYEEDTLQPMFRGKCCRDHITSVGEENAQFCPTCGQRLKDKDFNGELFMEYVTAFHSQTCDMYGESEGTNKREFAFWPWRAHDLLGASNDEVVFIGENAERVILDALFEVRADLRAQEIDVDDEEEWRTSCWQAVRKRGTTG